MFILVRIPKEDNMAKTTDQRYFIPAWVLEDHALSAGDKLVLCILSTRSTQIDDSGNRASYRIGAGAIADLLGYSYLQVTKILKKLEGRLIKKIDGGFLLISPDATAEEVKEAPAEEVKEAPVKAANLFAGCYTWEECKEALVGKDIRLIDLEASYESTLDSAPFKSNVYSYLQHCILLNREAGRKDSDYFLVTNGTKAHNK